MTDSLPYVEVLVNLREQALKAKDVHIFNAIMRVYKRGNREAVKIYEKRQRESNANLPPWHLHADGRVYRDLHDIHN